MFDLTFIFLLGISANFYSLLAFVNRMVFLGSRKDKMDFLQSADWGL